MRCTRGAEEESPVLGKLCGNGVNGGKSMERSRNWWEKDVEV